MANVIEIAKAGITAYNDKDLSKAKDMLAADAVYDEKGTHRRIQGAGEIVEAWQGWAKAFPDSKATFVGEFASGDTAVLDSCGRAFTPGHCRHQQVPFRHRTSRSRCRHAKSSTSRAV